MGRRWVKILGFTIIALLVLLSLAITFTIGWRPIIGPKARRLTDRHFELTRARLERGKYLVNSVMGCLGCHSEADLSKPGGPPAEAKLGAGTRWADANLPWVVAPNITPDKKPAPATGPTTHLRGRSAKGSVMTDGRCFR